MPHKDIDMFEDDLKKYCDKYVIGLETCRGAHKETNGEHFHVAAEIDNETYLKYKNNIYNKKYKLRGKALSGLPKQYGQVNDVRDKTRMMAYTLKDKNITYHNITLQELQTYIDQAYPKEDKWEQQIIDRLKLNIQPEEMGQQILLYDWIQEEIIMHYMEYSTQKAVPSKAYMKKIALRYLMYEFEHPSMSKKDIIDIIKIII